MLDNTEGWDWSQFDLDGDGRLDSVVIIHSGYGAETGRTDMYGTEMRYRIWAHAFAYTEDDWMPWISSDGSVRLNGYAVTSALEGYSGVVPATIGLTIHEFMHTFGIIDLYDSSGRGGIGAWDIMGYPYGHNGDGNYPGHLSTWSKLEAEWAQPEEITQDGFYTLRPLETSSDGYQIMLGRSEYLLLENRQRLEFDRYLFGSGLAIYHIDDNMDRQGSAGYPGYPGWPENGKHYRVAMLQKDGRYDLEHDINIGDAGDLWLPGDVLGPGRNNTVFPNTDSYCRTRTHLCIISESGITITVLPPDSELSVVFQVSGLGEGDASDDDSANATTPTANATADSTASPFDNSTDVTPPLANGTDTSTAAPLNGTTDASTVAPLNNGTDDNSTVVTPPPANGTDTSTAASLNGTTDASTVLNNGTGVDWDEGDDEELVVADPNNSSIVELPLASKDTEVELETDRSARSWAIESRQKTVKAGSTKVMTIPSQLHFQFFSGKGDILDSETLSLLMTRTEDFIEHALLVDSTLRPNIMDVKLSKISKSDAGVSEQPDDLIVSFDNEIHLDQASEITMRDALVVIGNSDWNWYLSHYVHGQDEGPYSRIEGSSSLDGIRNVKYRGIGRGSR